MANNKNLHQLFDEFIFECEYARKLRPETLRGYIAIFDLFVKLTPDLDIDLITPATIVRFFKVLEQRERIVGKGSVKTGVKKSTIATYWSKLNAFFHWLEAKDRLAKNPFAEMAYPTPTYEDKKFLKREEVEIILTAILNHSGKNILILKRNLVLFHVFIFCGLRKEEVLLLQVRDIDLGRRMITIRKETSKSGRTRFVPLHSFAMMHLRDYLNERKEYTTPYLFVSSTRDRAFSEGGINHLVDKLRKASKVRFHLHQLRHTFAVNFLKSSNNIAKLKQLLGHTSITMTLQYVRCLPPSEMRGDIESMNIDSFL